MKKIRIHPFFAVVLLLLFFFGFFNFALSYLLAVVLHELGHGVVAKKLGYSLNKIYLLPYGACLSYDDFAFKSKDEIKIAIAGPLTNLFLFLLSVSIWWLFPDIYNYTRNFALANIVTAIFNLCPAYPLDGARLFIAIMSEKNKRKLAYKICSIFNIILSCVLMFMFVLSAFFKINLTYGIMAIFLFFGIIENKFQGKYSPLLFNFSSSRENKTLAVKSLCVPSSTCFYEVLKEFNPHRYNLIYVKFQNGEIKQVSENQFKILIEKYNLETTFDDVFIFLALNKQPN